MNSKKLIALVLLVIQTTTLVLTLRYSRTRPVEGPRFLNSTVVVIAEVVKLLCCILMILKSKGYSLRFTVDEILREVIGRPIETFKIAIPSGMYAIQNNLLFIALSYLDAPTYQVTYQLKILSSAIFSVLLLGRSLNRLKWISLVLLMGGVALVQIPPENSEEKDPAYRWYGLFAIFCSCISSGFAGVYFEKLLKRSNQSLWIRNVQMALFGTIFGGLTAYFTNYEEIRKDGIFQGYDHLTWFVVILHAVGGLLVSNVIKYADNIVKSFAASLSIVISSAVSYFMFNEFHPGPFFTIGTAVVLFSTVLYSK
ncbi:UDP-N-acetylglucosamine transporter-like [Styela clava]|uniref:UDP-N-acetylglucosamine transporter-like n=1 Tax=Styela clava TaxID=7725 RepID=UPI00193A3B68|nr:UDP-N-acetylglucosamine transporter-like [Styela clava]